MIDEKQKKMIEDYAQMVAKNLILYGVDMRDKYDSAVSMSLALENAYLRGRSDGLKYAFEKVKKVGEWIPCSEGLPEKPMFSDKGYIVQQKRVVEPFCSYWNGEIWTDVDGEEEEDIIAWMPLPEPYKE